MTLGFMTMTREPVTIINGLIAIVEAGIAVAVRFGLKWDAKQVALVMAVVVAVGNLCKPLWSRGKVTPVGDPRDKERFLAIM